MNEELLDFFDRGLSILGLVSILSWVKLGGTWRVSAATLLLALYIIRPLLSEFRFSPGDSE